MPFPPIPDLPDDDPIRALRLFRDYAWEVANYLAPAQLLAASIAIPMLLFFSGWMVLGENAALSWGADLVPLTFAVISVVVSVRRVRETYQSAVIVFVLLTGLLGSLVMHIARVRSETEHHSDMSELRQRMDSVGNQNNLLLHGYLAKPVRTSQEAELERKQGVEKALRNEYILSHEKVSPGLLAGTEFPPADWMNKRLHELGERWTFTESPMPSRTSQPPEKPDAAILVSNLRDISITVQNTSKVVLREPRYSVGIFDLDAGPPGSDRTSLSVSIPSFKDQWLRAGDGFGPYPLFRSPPPAGHQLFGFIRATCPDCIAERQYWLSIVSGKSGWYGELGSGQVLEQRIMTDLFNASVSVREASLDRLNVFKIPIQ
jgi:hypothetical protein